MSLSESHQQPSTLNRYLHRARQILLVSIFGIGITINCGACQETNTSETLTNAEANREKMRNRISELRDKADIVFVGRIVKVTGESATFDDIVNLKGEGTAHFPYSWIESYEVVVGCGGSAELEYLIAPETEENDPWKLYLIYAIKDQIIRAAVVPSFANAPNPHEEIEWLKK